MEWDRVVPKTRAWHLLHALCCILCRDRVLVTDERYILPDLVFYFPLGIFFISVTNFRIMVGLTF